MVLCPEPPEAAEQPPPDRRTREAHGGFIIPAGEIRRQVRAGVYPGPAP